MASSPSAACLLLALVVLAGGWVDAHSATRRLLETSAPGPSPVSTEVAPADWCNQCGNVTDYEPVCGSDGQTYGNSCIPSCMNVRIAYSGKCNPACYPPGSSVEGDWSSVQPYCVVGLTFRNLAEATFNGYPQACSAPGVCDYGDRDGEVMTYIPTTGGKGLSVTAAAANTAMPSGSAPAPYDYVEALSKVLVYLDGQISGKIEPKAQRLTWRGDSCLTCKGKYGEDLTGGYYESGGSSMKMSVVHNFQVSLMAWAGVFFKKGFQASGTMDELKWKVKHGADYLLNSLVSQDPCIFAGANGNSTQDFDNFSPLEYYEQYVGPRPTGYFTAGDPGSEATGGAAAALAAAAYLLKSDMPEWYSSTIAKATALYEFASTNPKSFKTSSDPVIKLMQALYATDGDYHDELTWAAAWLYKATGKKKFLSEAEKWWAQSTFHNTLEVWNYYGANAVLLASLDPGNGAYATGARQFFDQYLTGAIGHTLGGAAYPYHWSSNMHVANVAMLGAMHADAMAAADAGYAARLLNYAHFQVDYLLGDVGRSWIVGFGNDYPTYLWHKPSYFSTSTWTEAMGEKLWTGRDVGPWSSKQTGTDKFLQRGQMVMISSLQPQPHIAYGAVWGSPLYNDGLIASRKDYTYAEPSNPANTAIVGALAHMVQFYGLQGPYTGDMDEVLDVDYSDLLSSA
ncbi:hypothetical protein ACKKBF_B09970 [Auxenochlorella protothecoides x Auxenochlorella symbiontica]